MALILGIGFLHGRQGRNIVGGRVLLLYVYCSMTWVMTEVTQVVIIFFLYFSIVLWRHIGESRDRKKKQQKKTYFFLHSRLSVRIWLLRDSDSGAGSSCTCLRGHLNRRTWSSYWESFSTQRGLLLEDPLNIWVTGGLLQLLTVHSVAERIHHSNLKNFYKIKTLFFSWIQFLKRLVF